MVLPISSSHMAKLRPISADSQPAARPATNGADLAPKAIDRVSLHGSPVASMVAGIKDQGPPFDAEKVTSIRQALAAGSYPVDRDRLADQLSQDLYAIAR
jgi:negative regulator of flagellin synthesis FlgM